MKNLFICCLLTVSTYTFAQNKIATTEDGKKVILKSDKTWEYSTTASSNSVNDCNLGADFKEPKGMNSMTLRMTNATTDDLKKHVAVENDCNVSDVKLINISEQKGNGMYSLCVKGKVMKYRRTGSVFSRLDEDILKPKN